MAMIEKRISKNGTITYRARVRIKGYPEQSATFKSKTHAKSWAEKTEIDIKANVHGSVFESKKHTLAELIDRYMSKGLCGNGGGAADKARHLLIWKDYLGNYALSALTSKLIIDTRDSIASISVRGKTKSNATVNRYMAALSAVLTYAVKELEWLDINPVSRITKMQEPQGRVRYLSDSERENLLIAAQNSNSTLLYPIILVALTTGARKMEILKLRWENINFESKMATLNNTKNGDRRGLPLVEPALGELKKLYDQRGNSPYVFPSHNGQQPFDITYCWKKAIKDAGLNDFRFHDLRHTCASYLAMDGATMGEIAAVLGHKTLDMTKRYSHFSPQHLHSVSERITKKYFNGGNNGN